MEGNLSRIHAGRSGKIKEQKNITTLESQMKEVPGFLFSKFT